MNVLGPMKNKIWSNFSKNFIEAYPQFANILDNLDPPQSDSLNKVYSVLLKDKPYLSLEVTENKMFVWFTRFPQRRMELDLAVLPNLVDTLIEIQNGHNI